MATGRSESSGYALAQGIVPQRVFYGRPDSDRPSHGRTTNPPATATHGPQEREGLESGSSEIVVP